MPRGSAVIPLLIRDVIHLRATEEKGFSVNVSTVTGEAIGSGGGPPRDLFLVPRSHEFSLLTSTSLHVSIDLPSPLYVLQFKFWKEPTDCTCYLFIII